MDVCLFTGCKKVQKIELNNQKDPIISGYPSQIEGEANTTSYLKFKLQPNKYVFEFEIRFENTSAKKVDLLLKIGSTSECTFEEIKNEDRTRSKRVKDHISSYSVCQIFFNIFLFASLAYLLMLVLFFTYEQ